MKDIHKNDAHATVKYIDTNGEKKEKTYYSKSLSGKELFDKKVAELKKTGTSGICGSSHNAW